MEDRDDADGDSGKRFRFRSPDPIWGSTRAWTRPSQSATVTVRPACRGAGGTTCGIRSLKRMQTPPRGVVPNVIPESTRDPLIPTAVHHL